MKLLRNLSLAFTGGAIGGFIDSVNIWLMGTSGISDMINITMKPAFTKPWLYKRMIWGGIWMLPLLLPILKNRICLRGMLLSLAPSAMMIFMVLPSMKPGDFGTGFGMLMPAVVIILNLIYGTVASTWYSLGKR
jgi:hypothetical protein